MILLTGGSGFIGRLLVDRLLSEGHPVAVLERNTEGARDGVKFIKGDITDPESLKGAFSGAETVMHLAGMISYSKPREEIMKVNALGTENVLDACKDAGIKKFIISSSVSVYGKIKGVADEGYETKPMNPYGESKLEAERFVRESGLPSVILRIAPVYGKGSPRWMKNLKLLEKGFPIPNTRNLTHVVHVSDVVQAFVRSVEKGRGIYNIADRTPVPFVDFAEMIVRELGRKPRRMPPWAVSLMARATRMKTYLDVLTANRNYDISKAASELGYSPEADLIAKTKEMIEWYKAESAAKK